MREKLPWLTEDTKRLVEALIPELAESEDEKTRKEILNYILYKASGVSEEDEHRWVTWLEKQKEQKPSIFPPGFGEVRWNPISSVQQKPSEWSEEDEEIRKWCISHFKDCFHVSEDNLEFKQYLSNKIIPWLEKQRPLKWSNEDEKMKESIIKVLYGGGHFAYEEEINWLKSLHPSWKPSEEQMEALRLSFEDAFDDAGDCYRYRELKSIYEQLKKLM